MGELDRDGEDVAVGLTLGDGLALPEAEGDGAGEGDTDVLLSWGSAPQTVARSTSRIYFSTVSFAKAAG